MLGFEKFVKTVFECGRISKSAWYENRDLFLVALMSKNRFSLCLCDFFAVCCHIVLFKFMIKFSLFDDVLRKKTDAMDFMGSFFHYFTKIPTLGKRGSHNLH